MQLRKSALLVAVLSVALGLVEAQQCEEPNVAVIVVASVFATLAVVFIVLGIIFFLLWKRRRDIQNVPGKQNNHKAKTTSPSGEDGGFVNPSFSGDGDISHVEEGIGGYVKCREQTSPEKKKISKSSIAKDPTKKTWTSLPKSDLPPGPLHNGSAGSLDDHFLSDDPEVSSVWLQSQDFIGLGFNIAGSMRDGIYVSQVHNRGPAMESGKFKVGDRILTVTISFENMVYEDALTILSYASPYPVKVTLQKDNQIHKERRNSGTSSTLSHPLYRSQSADTLLKAAREPTFHPSRSFDEMCQTNSSYPEKKKSPVHKGKQDKENRYSSESIEQHPAVPSVTMVTEIQTKAEIEGRPVTETEISNSRDFDAKHDTHGNVLTIADVEPIHAHVSTAQITFAGPSKNDNFPEEPPPEPAYPPPPLDFNDGTDGGATNTVELSEVFDNLNEQDRLDMLRLSYENLDASPQDNQILIPPTPPQFDTSINDSNESFTSGDTTLVEVEPKSPVPVKPERRKKKSSSGSSSMCDSPTSPRIPVLPPDDIVMETTVQPTNLAPQLLSPMETLENEINEDEIVPEKKTRYITISDQKIEVSAHDGSMDTPYIEQDSPRDVNRTLVDYSLSDMESTLRPQTPEIPVIEEDMITPVQAKKDESSFFSSRLFENTPTSESKIDKSQGQLQHSTENSSFLSSGDDKSESNVENLTITSADFNLNMNEDLFSTPYPSRNTKETASGITYDISVMELNDMESQMRKNTKTGPKGGIAFEVREDVVSGTTVLTSVPQDSLENHISRAVSYHGNMSTNEKSKLPRPASFKGDGKSESENALEWSGKRLIRSGSFTDIPQDDSVKDWTDQNILNDENGNTESVIPQESVLEELTSSEESLHQPQKKGLSKMSMFRAREDLANLSDNSESLLTMSSSSSRSSTPPPPYTANGEQVNEISPETSPIKTPVNLTELNSPNSGLTISTDLENNDLISNVTNKREGTIPFSVSVNADLEEEADC